MTRTTNTIRKWPILLLTLCCVLAAGQEIPQFSIPKPAAPAPVRTPERSPETPVAPPPAPAAAPASKGTASDEPVFYGIKLEGKNVAFLLDTSGSMSGQRLQSMKKELHAIIVQFRNPSIKSGIDEDATYRLWVFSDGIKGVFPEKYNAKAKNRTEFERAEKFIDGLQVSGGTAMLRAWEEMFKSYGAQPPDTIYFLSDGDPTDCQPHELLEFLRKRNPEPRKSRRSRIKINCISVGQTSKLLQDIAEENRGRYTEAQ
jgi:uncharacterized protein YegL